MPLRARIARRAHGNRIVRGSKEAQMKRRCAYETPFAWDLARFVLKRSAHDEPDAPERDVTRAGLELRFVLGHECRRGGTA